MPDFTHRSTELEIMDDLEYAGGLMDKTLRELEVINKWLGGNAVTLSAIATLLHRYKGTGPIHIADLGCGRGDMLRIIDQWAAKRKLPVTLTGIDANPYIVARAREHLSAYHHIALEALNIFSPEFKTKTYDVVIGTLFYHHFNVAELTLFFRQLRKQSRIGFVINDIHRHPVAYYSIKVLTRLFSRSSMVQYDAPLSVLRAFKRKELEQCLHDAGIQRFTIRWRWAFRWQVVVPTDYEF